MIKIVFLLFTLTFTFSALADSISLFFIKSPYGINWSTPWSMTTTTIKNQLAPSQGRSTNHTISHTYAEINCSSTGIKLYRGMTSDGNDEERTLLFKKKYGLGVMFHTYRGKLEKEETLLNDINDYYGNSRLSKLVLKISPEACQRMVEYVNEYEAKGYAKMYSGLQADPLRGEGSGCSAFVVSFMRVAGLMESFTEQWKQTIDVPLNLVGGPMTGNKVSIFKVLMKVNAKWSNRTPFFHLVAWDPELMHSWLLRTYESVKSGEYTDFDPEIDRYQKTKILKLDLSDRSTPQGPVWTTPQQL